MNVLIRRPRATWYLMRIIMSVTSISISEIFAVETSMALTVTFRMDQVQIYYAKVHVLHHIWWQLLYNVSPIFVRFELSIKYLLSNLLSNLLSINLLSIRIKYELDLYKVSRSNVNMPIERAYATFCVCNSNVCPICHCLRDKSHKNLPMYSIRIFDLENEGQGGRWFGWKSSGELFQRTYMCKKLRFFRSSRSFAIEHFVKDVRTYARAGRTSVLPASITPFTFVWTVLKTDQ